MQTSKSPHLLSSVCPARIATRKVAGAYMSFHSKLRRELFPPEPMQALSPLPTEAKSSFRLFSASSIVLFLLCLMYLLTYIDRVNVSTASNVFEKELHLDKTQVGFVFSAFAYPYLLFQIIGGFFRCGFRPH